jgi:two-component system NtrC family sensor kinase
MKTAVAVTDEEVVLKVLNEHVPVGVCIMQNGRFCYINSFFSMATGYTAGELVGSDSLGIVVPEDREMVRENTMKMLRGETLSSYQFRVVRKDRGIMWVVARVKPTQYRGAWAILGNYIDITERKQAEDKLEESERKYQTILEEMGDGYFETDLAGNLTFVNDAMTRHLGYSTKELIGMNFRDLRPEEAAKTVFEAYNRVYKTGKPLRGFFTEIICKDGTHAFAETSAFPMRNDKGEIIGFQGIRHDITQRKQAEEALENSERRYRQLAENAGEAIFVVKDAAIEYINPRGAELSGYSVQEMISKPFVQFIHPDDVATVADRYARRLEGEAVPQMYEFRMIRKDGESRWVDLNAVKASWDDSPAVLCLASDITERKEAEEASRQSEEKYRAMLERMEDSYSDVDLSGNVTFVNSAACRHLGYPREELLGMNYKDFTAEDYVKPIFQIYNTVYRTGVPNKGFHWKIIRKDGSHWIIDGSVSPLRNTKGEIIGFSTVGRDVTERLRMEQQLIIADRLASIGQLAAGTAHELNNPLTAVIGFSEMLLERDLPVDAKADLKTVNQEAKRAVNIIKGLLSFAREQRIEKSPVDINGIIREVLQLRSYEQRVNNIEVVARLSPALPTVMGNAPQLQQVFMNVIVNAEQAMLECRGRGNLTIVTKQVDDIVETSITDDGPGISPDDMKQLFQPFFTTKEVGKGTGLGLSISHGIVAAHGGHMYADSELGRGATFVIRLPIVAQTGKPQ